MSLRMTLPGSAVVILAGWLGSSTAQAVPAAATPPPEDIDRHPKPYVSGPDLGADEWKP